MDQDDITYHDQDDPFSGGITISVTITDEHKKAFLKEFRHCDLSSASSIQSAFGLFWLSKKEPGKHVATCVLNRIDAVEITKEAIHLTIAASPLLSAQEWATGKSDQA